MNSSEVTLLGGNFSTEEMVLSTTPAYQLLISVTLTRFHPWPERQIEEQMEKCTRMCMKGICKDIWWGMQRDV